MPKTPDTPIEGSLEAIKTYLAANVAAAETDMGRTGSLPKSAGLLESADAMSDMISGEPSEVNNKLLAWYEKHNGSIYKELFPLIGAYLLEAGLISEEKQPPINEISEDATIEEIVTKFREWLADPDKGSAENRAFWQSVVDRADEQAAAE